jgi:hypothetical protein
LASPAISNVVPVKINSVRLTFDTYSALRTGSALLKTEPFKTVFQLATKLGHHGDSEAAPIVSITCFNG